MKSVFLVLLSCLCLFSCKKKEANSVKTTNYHTVYRTNMLRFGFVGFDTAKLDTVVVRRYIADGTFATIASSSLVIPRVQEGGTWTITGSFDDSLTNSLYLLVNSVCTAYQPYDYEVVVPSVGRTYKITGVQFTSDSAVQVADCCPVMVGTRNASYVLDGTRYAPADAFSLSGIYIWLKR